MLKIRDGSDYLPVRKGLEPIIISFSIHHFRRGSERGEAFPYAAAFFSNKQNGKWRTAAIFCKTERTGKSFGTAHLGLGIDGSPTAITGAHWTIK